MIARTLLGLALLIGALGAAQAVPVHKSTHHPTHKAKAAKPAPAPEEDWSPDPAMLAQLGPETPFGPYTLRLPPDLTLVGQQRMIYQRHVEDVSKFQGEQRPNGSRLTLFVVVASAGSNTIFAASANELMQRMDDKIFASATSHVQSPSVYGRINGLETLRQYFKATDKDGPAHGFQYWMAGPTSAIVIICSDAEPYNATTLPLAEAAALTLNKQ